MSTTQAMRQLIDENATIKAELERLRADVQHWREARDAALAEGDLMRQELERLRTESEMRRIALLDEMQSAERLRAQVAPAGWKLVPVEPTEEMLIAGGIASEGSPAHDVIGPLSDAWAAMLAAAPAQQAESPCACWPGRMCSRSTKCAEDVLATSQQAAPAEIWYSQELGDFVTSDPGEPGFVRYARAPSLTVGERDCPHCNYTGAAHCGDVADKIKACGGEVVDCSHAKVYGLRATAPAGRRVCNFPNCTCKVFDGTACEPEQTVAVRAASSDIVHRLRVAASEWLPTSEHTLRAHNLLEEAANALAYRPAQPAAQAEPVAVKFACWDADNGMETFDTHAEALEYATATLSYYRDDAKSDGEWPGDVDSMWVGAIHITHKPAATMPDDDGGVDYALQPVSTQPAAQGLGKEEPDKWAQYVAGMVVAYLGGGVDDERIKPIAGVIESRLWALQPDAGTSVAVPAGLARSDAEFWLRHRAAIIAALQEAGLSIVSGANGASLMRLGKAEAQGAQAPTAEPRHALPDDEIHNPYQYSRGSAKVWLNGFRAGERAHGIAAMASQKE